MESPDVVDTSDVEEREAFTLSEDPVGHRLDPVNSLPLTHATGKDPVPGSSTRHERLSDLDGECPSPRKRIKIVHSPNSASPDIHPAEASFLSDRLSKMTAVQQIPEHSADGILGVDVDQESVSFSAPPGRLSPHPDWHSLFSAERNLSDAASRAVPQSADPSASQIPPHFQSHSLSDPPNHSHPFSSPRLCPTTPPRSSSQHSHDQSVSGRREPLSLTLSPLTPVSSPAFRTQTPSQSPDPLQILPPWRNLALVSRPDVSSAIAPHVRSPPVEIPEDPRSLGRYSLRRREARQLNPYAYDKFLYKQQLKSHPDAIVKFSPRRRPGSGGVGEGGTQDDGDYLDVGEESNTRRNKTHGSHRHLGSEEDGQGLEARTKVGWLPEILKELSSSDEGGDEIRKLARSVRRDREKAEALARVEARRTGEEARQSKKTTRRRPRPFPVHEGAKSTNSPECVPVGLSPLPSPLPPSGSRFGLARGTSDSPSSGSDPLRSLDFSVYLDQEGLCGFDDNDAGFPRNPSPVHRSATSSTPPGPSAPPTTSGTSLLQSNTSDMESESDQPSMFEMSSKDRKRLRALNRMMPAAMVARQLAISKAVPLRTRVAMESSASEAEEVRVIPGLARIRKGRYRNVEVRGDPESSDAEPPVNSDIVQEDTGLIATEFSSDGQSAVRVSRTRCVSSRIKCEGDVISLSDSSLSSAEESGNDRNGDEKARRSLFDRPAREPARESVIDWMLCRPRGPSRSKSKLRQPAHSRKPHGSGVPRLDIVTSGARRGQHQTRLPFVRTTASLNATSLTEDKAEHRDRIVQPDAVEQGKKQKWGSKHQSRAKQGPLYNVHHDATRITSKHREGRSRRGTNALVIENDNEFMQALDPGWRTEVERWNKTVSPIHQPVAHAATTTPATSRSRLYPRTSPRIQDEVPLPFYFQREEGPSVSTHRHIIVNMDITPLPSGIKFGAPSYIERGHLHQLILVSSGNTEIASPISCNMQGLVITPTTSAAEFRALFGPLCDRLAGALRDPTIDNAETMKGWEPVTHASSQLLSWLAVHAEDQEFVALEAAFQAYSDGLLLVLESLETSIFSLSAYWFLVELSARLAAGIKYRRASVENGHLIRTAKKLMQRLLSVDLQPAFATFRAPQDDVAAVSLPYRVAELWVCLIHLLPNFEISTETNCGHTFWRLLADLHPDSYPTGAEASEDVWRTIFSLCAISQFSVYGLSTSAFRLPAAWELVVIALKKIVLTSNPEKERRLPQRALRKRDDYLSCVVSRCFLLWKQWKWRLDDGILMFKSLQEIFRSRNFTNLLNERSVPMGFLEHGDLELLSKRDPHDSVFEIYLKMVVQAVYLLNANVELDAKQRSAHIKKLLQMAVPVSPVPFSRSAPPTAHSLSMLVNRYSAMVVAVHLDPTSPNVKFRIGQARRCVSFKDADDRSRVACVYGMMNFAMIIRHHRIPGGLDEALGWLGEMADVLMDEYKEGEMSAVGKETTTTLIQLLIGSVRRVIETQSLDRGQSRTEYPDPALLDGPWVTRVFNPRTDLVTIQQTGVEIRMLVQSFLDARQKALPDVQPPPPPVVHSAESQESQDEYDKVFLDLNDEELLAALGEEAEASAVADLKAKEVALCKVLDKSITPAVYRLVCKFFGDSEHGKSDAMKVRAADQWIDCWVGCANVLVQNNCKDWGLYMKLGQQSWEKIINDSWRRRVGLRFSLTLLRLDPRAYSKMKDEFIAVLLVATLSSKATIEHEFMSIVLSLDALQHPLLRAAPFYRTPETRRYEISKDDYGVAREQLIEAVITGASICLRARVDAESHMYVELVLMMLSTMRDIYQSAEDKNFYGEFCQRVFGMVMGHGELVSHPRIADVLVWARREWNV